MKKTKPLLLGTRDSKLAMWQAETFAAALKEKGIAVEIKAVKSSGDLDLSRPIHEMGYTGVFTKTLDDALLAGKIDLAVHSLKDVPTRPPEGLGVYAVLDRANPKDVFVPKDQNFNAFPEAKATIFTGSIRRKAQLLHRFPQYQTANIRGNVITRMAKIEAGTALGGIFAHAGLARLNLLPKHAFELDWMIPAPAQGIVAAMCRTSDAATIAKLEAVNHSKTAQAAAVERAFMRQLEGGCSAPIGAFLDRDCVFHVGLFSPNGQKAFQLQEKLTENCTAADGIALAKRILAEGGSEIMKEIRDEGLTS